MKRDFTYIEDLIIAISLLIDLPPVKEKLTQSNLHLTKEDIPYRIVNIGNSKSVNLLDYISEIENCIGKKTERKFLGMQQGDVQSTLASNDLLYELTGFKPKTTFKEGIPKFIKWFKNYQE